MRKKKVCFVALYAYPLFNKSATSVFGGSEVRCHLFSTTLAKYEDYDVSCVVFDHGQPSAERIDGVTLHAHTFYRRPLPDMSGAGRENMATRIFGKIADALDPVLAKSQYIGKTFVERSKLDVYEKVDADVYITLGLSDLAAEVALHCRNWGKRFVLMTSTENDFSDMVYAGSSEIDEFGNNGGMRHFAAASADIMITQTERHSAEALRRYGKHAAVIGNPIAMNESGGAVERRGGYALWIGKTIAVKQPEILLWLARQAPEIKFIMVLNNTDEEVYKDFAAAATSNVEIIESVQRAELAGLFGKASVFVNTSTYEGFPNTFLEAGKYGAPILSLNIDPDGYIEKYGCGIAAHGSTDELLNGLRKIMFDSSLADTFSRNIMEYTRKNHGIAEMTGKLKTALDGLLAAK